jgi:transposase
MAYSNDLRRAVVHAVMVRKQSQASVARLLHLGLNTVRRILERKQQTGNPDTLPHGGGQKPKLTEEQKQAVRAYLAEHPAAYLRELALWLEQEHSVRISLSSLSRRLTRLGLSRKKGRGTPVNAIRPSRASAVASGVSKLNK